MSNCIWCCYFIFTGCMHHHTQHATNTQNKENMQGEYKIEFSNNPPYSFVVGNDEKIIFNFLNLSLQQQQCKGHNCMHHRHHHQLLMYRWGHYWENKSSTQIKLFQLNKKSYIVCLLTNHNNFCLHKFLKAPIIMNGKFP